MRFKFLLSSFFIVGVFVCSVIFSPFILDYTLSPRLIFFSLTVLFSLIFIVRNDFNFHIKIDFLILSYLLFCCFCCFSIFWSNTKSESIFESNKVLLAFGSFSICHMLFQQNGTNFLHSLCKLSCLIILIEFIVILFQLSHLSEFNKQSLYAIYGLNSHKNLVSSFLLLQLFFVVVGLFEFTRIWKYTAIFCFCLCVLILALLQTKAVWIGIGVTLLCFICMKLINLSNFKFNIRLGLILALVFFNIFFVFILPQIIKRGISFNESQSLVHKSQRGKELDNERLLLWDKTYNMINKHPIAGVGIGNWQIYFPDAGLKNLWRAEDLNYTFQRPHNDFLWQLSELGILGFNLFLIFIAGIVFTLFSFTNKNTLSKNERLKIILCASILLGYFVASFFDFPRERSEHSLWLSIILAFGYYCIKKNYLLKSFFELYLSKKSFSSLILISTCLLLINLYRYNGEYHTRKLYNQKALSNYFGVLQEGKKSISSFYQIDPTSIPIKWYTGNAHAALGNYKEAHSDLLLALDQNPYNRNVLNDLGSSYAVMGEETVALNYYSESLRISPRFDDPKLNMIAIYIKQKKYEKADSSLNTLFHDSERRSNYEKMVNAFLGKTPR